ncbi:hypothetical protein [Butyrivibrio sp. AE2032]|uniref:hypothetical protein n=1 Tax=Butyrivibrio sp. AE2032 TaxID=1458463 RepID=UPI0005525E90|nr:hypothetical protein [Butyrivibrio sp. AE2032]
MTSDYSNYINKATSRLVELLSSDEIRRAEKDKYITSLTDSFVNNAFSPELIEPYDVLFAKESIIYIDGLLSEYSKIQPLDLNQLNDAVMLCDRQKKNIAFLNAEKIALPHINISNIDQFLDSIKLSFDNNCFLNKTLQLDRMITESCLKMSSYNEEECNYIFSLLDELDKNISECKMRRIDFSKVKNVDTGRIRNIINNSRTKKVNNEYWDKTCSIDKKISQILDGAGRTDEAMLNQALTLVDEIEPRILECRTRGINVDTLKNKDTSKVRNVIAAYRQELSEKSVLLREIVELDHKLVNVCNMWLTDSSQIATIVALCDKCDSLINDFKKRGWNVPVLRCISPNYTKSKYLCYEEMLKIDKILSESVKDSTKERHKLFLDNVEKQKGNILLCSQYNWAIPNLMIKDLDGAVNEHNRFIVKKRLFFTVAIISAIIFSICVVIVCSAAIARYRYMKTHTRMPASLEESRGNYYLDVVEELTDAGFRNVYTKPVPSGIQKGGVVTDISVDGSNSFKYNEDYSVDSEIVVYYFSVDRVDLTPLLQDWHLLSADDLYEKLYEMGFDVVLYEKSNSTISNNNKVISININEIDYDSGECFVPRGATIVLNYYGKAYQLNYGAEFLIGKKYQEVKLAFEKLGFDNIEFKRNDDALGLIFEEGSVESVTINGKSDFKKGDVFCHDAKIVITVHTKKDNEYPDID